MKRIPQEKIDKGFGRPFDIITQENLVLDKKVVKRSNVVSYDPREVMSQYDCADFYLENIIAAGAIQGLKECQLYGNRLMTQEEVDKEINSFVDTMDEYVNNNVKNTNE